MKIAIPPTPFFARFHARKLVAAAAILASVLCVPLAHADDPATIISVNFQGKNDTLLEPGDEVGAPSYAAVNWNNVAGKTGGPLSLNDSTGALSPITLTFYGSTQLFGATPPDGSSPQRILLGGGIDPNWYSGDVDFTLDGLSAFDSYDLVVYYTAGTDNPSARQAVFSISGSPVKYYVEGSSLLFTDYILGDSTTDAVYSSANYVVFSGLTDSSQSLTMKPNNEMAISGFQIIGYSAAVPEPSAPVLALGGFAALVIFQRRRRCGSRMA